MAKYILNENKPDKRIISIDTTSLYLDIRELPEDHRSWLKLNDFLVDIGLPQKFEFNKTNKKFYFYTCNEQKTSTKIEEDSIELEWLSLKDQRSKLVEWGIEYTEYLDQWEYTLLYNGENLSDKILSLIK